jgi:hypothetical protein
MEKIGYHNGKEYFRLNRAGSAHAARKATENKFSSAPSGSKSRPSLKAETL